MQDLAVENLTKSFNGTVVLENISYTFPAGSINCIMGGSGIGKTTFLRLLLGLIQPDSGKITGLLKPSAVFQEDRLIEHISAVENVKLVLNGKNARQQAKKHLEELLPKDALEKPVSALSGGMRRRVALARAMAADSNIVFLDEPFTGLDTETVRLAVSYVLQYQNGRTLIAVTHDRAVCKMLGAKICLLTSSKAVATIL